MKAGVLVKCHCAADVWYSGLIGMLIGFDHHGRFVSDGKGDPLVMYGNGKTVRLVRSGLEGVS